MLDIGSGSGLLAMMAVRAGAKRVSSLEMVPAMAAVCICMFVYACMYQPRPLPRDGANGMGGAYLLIYSS